MRFIYPLLLLITFYLSVPVFAQQPGNLTGLIKDEKNAAVGFANVAVVQAENKQIITGAISDEQGKFQIKSPAPGTYFLRISAIGFLQKETEAFSVSGENFTRTFPDILMHEDSKTLQEVTVKSMRPTIINQPDKMVMSVEGTAMAAGSTAYEVLAKAPGVWLDQEGNVQLNGKAGVRVMLDGKLTYLSGKELQALLQGMPADNIKNLEIITNPSAKYDAEGSSGIININLKKNLESGLNGSVYAGYQHNGLFGYSSGGNLNYKKSRWNSFASLDVSRRTNIRTNTMNREFNSESENSKLIQKGREEGIRFNPSLRIGTDYEINKKHSVGASANLTYMNSDNTFNTITDLRDGNPANDLLITARNLTTREFGNGTFNAHYLGKLDSAGSTFSTDLDYVKLIFNGNGSFSNLYQPVNKSLPENMVELGSKNPSGFDIYSVKADYAKPLNKTNKLEFGAKASHVISDNDLQFYMVNNGEKTNDPNRSNHFIYQENIYAAYANFNMNVSDNVSIQTGLRGEKTVAQGHSVTLDQLTKRNYLNFFPSIFVQQKVNANYQLNYNFSRRIDRPSYNTLNPFIFYLDPYSWAQGNPYLKPQYTNSFQLTQTWKDTYNLILNYSRTKDFMAEIPEQFTETNTTVFQTRNVDFYENESATLVVPVKVSAKWEMNNNLSFEHQNYTILLNEKERRNEQLSFAVQSNHNVQLPQNIRMELNAGYQGPSAYGLYKINGNWWLDAGMKRTFLKDKLELALNVTDIFKTRKIIGAANIDGNVNAFDQYFGMQSFRVNLRYRFNKGEKFDVRRRNTTLEESRRAGGN